MPKYKTKFQERWLTEVDSDGHRLQSWCVKGSTDHSARCTIYKTEIKCDNSGINQILQHSKGSQHKKLSESILSSKQTKLTFKVQPS
jgi:hypothetical protein